MDIFQMSLSASVLIVAVLIIRALTLNKLPKKTFLVLWGVVLCRLLIPFSIPSRFSFYTGINTAKHMFADKAVAPSPAGITVTPNIANMSSVGETMKVSAHDASTSSLEIVWLAGICACALFFIVAYIKCRREFKISLPVENDFASLWLQEHPLRRSIQIRQSDRINAPLTYGVFRPVVLLPKTTDWTDETSLRYILAHEYAHIRCFDTLTKLILTAAVCVHWFNPLVWVMFMLANRDIELSCDEIVIRTFGETTKSAYALTLIGMEEKKGQLAPLVNNFSKNAIEERIVSIMKIKRTSLVGIIMALALVIGTTTVFATNAANSTDNKPEKTNPASAHDISVVKTPTASPQNGSTKSDTGGSVAEQTNGATKEGPISQIPSPSSEDSGNGTDDSSNKGYPVNKNGETYGSATMRETLGLHYDADMMEAIGTEGQRGYIRLKDEASKKNMSSTPEGYRSIPLLDVNGYVIGSFILSHSVAIENGVYLTFNYVYPVNKNGETYGSSALGHPDLVAAMGTEGQSGYIRDSEVPGANVSTLEEAAAYMEWRKTQPSTILIPLYDQEGNVIGTFGVSNVGNDKHYDSLEEARAAFANGDCFN